MSNDPSKCYWIILYDPKGENISKKLLRVWPGEDAAVEHLGGQIGKELARDAISDANELAETN